jgi:hypothetical protein
MGGREGAVGVATAVTAVGVVVVDEESGNNVQAEQRALPNTIANQIIKRCMGGSIVPKAGGYKP